MRPKKEEVRDEDRSGVHVTLPNGSPFGKDTGNQYLFFTLKHLPKIFGDERCERTGPLEVRR